MKKRIKLQINNSAYELEVDPGERLLDTLRSLGFTEVKEGCGSGECGACTVIENDRTICSCLSFSEQSDGRSIRTSKQVAEDMPYLLEHMVQEGAVQCGFCTPGIMVSAAHLIERSPTLTEQEIKDGLEGNLCRCTGYTRIIAAVKKASAQHGQAGELVQYDRGELRVKK